jgi:hypothetical protein
MEISLVSFDQHRRIKTLLSAGFIAAALMAVAYRFLDEQADSGKNLVWGIMIFVFLATGIFIFWRSGFVFVNGKLEFTPKQGIQLNYGGGEYFFGSGSQISFSKDEGFHKLNGSKGKVFELIITDEFRVSTLQIMVYFHSEEELKNFVAKAKSIGCEIFRGSF